MTDSLCVCQVINSLGYGGAEHLLLDLVDEMDTVEMTVVSLGRDDDLAATLRKKGATVEIVGEAFRFDPRTLQRLRGIFTSRKFDVVHNHLPYAQTMGRLGATLAGVSPIISTQHNVPSNFHPVTRWSERATRWRDDAVIAVSKAVERAHTGRAHEPNELGDRWCTIYNGIDVERYHKRVRNSVSASVRKELGVAPEELMFLNVGRYVAAKAQESLIQAFARSGIEEAVLVLVGHGPREDALRRKAREENVEEQVYVTGRVPDVPPYYAAADVFVTSSTGEGMPVTLLEAMASELPVVASAIGGVDEVVVDGTTGRLYTLGDVEGLSELLVDFREDGRRKRYGKAGYERVQSTFDIQTMANAYRDLYDLTIRQHG